MASITKRGDTWRVLIRKKGYNPVSETFKLKASAEKWARETEAKMDRRVYVVDDKQTVASIFDRYRNGEREAYCRTVFRDRLRASARPAESSKSFIS